MAIDMTAPIQPVSPQPPEGTPMFSPLWWCYMLADRLRREREELERLGRYHDGRHDLPYVRSAKVQAQYQRLLNQAQSNFMRFVVRAKVERLRIQGVRLADAANPTPDVEAWKIWTDNDLAHLSKVAYSTALARRRCYWSVWWPRTGTTPIIRIEDPTQVYVHRDPETGEPLVGIKVFVDEWTGEERANVATTKEIHRFRWAPATRTEAARWVPREEPEPNRLGALPWVPMEHGAGGTTTPGGWSEIEDLIPIQDRINFTLLNRMVAEHLAAFRQKWATGLEIPEDENGKPVAPFEASITELWVNEDPAGKFGSFESTDLKNYAVAIEQDVQHIAVLSATPRHYFMVSGQEPSGDSMRSANAGLIVACYDIQRSWNRPQLRVLELARRIAGEVNPAPLELVWADPENLTLGQQVDAGIKLIQAEVTPRSWLLERIGETPTRIAQLQRQVLQERMLYDLGNTNTAADAVTL